MVAGAKKVALMCLGLGRAEARRGKLEDQQEVLGHFADIAMETYALESALLRTQKRAAARGEDAGARCRRRPCAASPRTRWTRSRPRPASSWPRSTRATCCARYLAALKRFTKREA